MSGIVGVWSWKSAFCPQTAWRAEAVACDFSRRPTCRAFKRETAPLFPPSVPNFQACRQQDWAYLATPVPWLMAHIADRTPQRGAMH